MKWNVPGASSSGRSRVYPAGGCAAPTSELSLPPALRTMAGIPRASRRLAPRGPCVISAPAAPVCSPGPRSGRGEGTGSPCLESRGLAGPADPGLGAGRRSPGWGPAQGGRMLPAAGASWGAGRGRQVWEPQGPANPCPTVCPKPGCWAAAGGGGQCPRPRACPEGLCAALPSAVG